jgi:hypothetical protein
MRYINEKTLADGGHAIRSVHAKSHGILQGYLEVDAVCRLISHRVCSQGPGAIRL